MSPSVRWYRRCDCGVARAHAGSGATYPLDLVRARLSVATANVAMGASTSTTAAFTAEDAKLGIVGMTKKVYATEGGIRGL